jgi:hypothetical protein
MSVSVLDRSISSHLSGAVFRRQRRGPEAELVTAFLENFPFIVPQGCRATVFCEPRIESGFPDLVIVFWSVATARKWASARTELTNTDIRLIQYFHEVGPAPMHALKHVLTRGLAGALERLEAAELVRRLRGDVWKPRSLNDNFATRRIIAVEAKISAWSEAIDQAFLNTWFASDSFVLLPHKKASAAARAAARLRGIRLCSPDKPISCKRPAYPNRIPRSYASWLFNEWAWRSAALGGGLPS